jgi:hypothetical protein
MPIEKVRRASADGAAGTAGRNRTGLCIFSGISLFELYHRRNPANLRRILKRRRSWVLSDLRQAKREERCWFAAVECSESRLQQEHLMKNHLIASSFAALMIAAAPAAIIGVTMAPPAAADTAAIPLDRVVGAKAVDRNNDTVGDVVGAVVSENGGIKSLIIDVGSWISGKKDVELPWSGVVQDKDGNLVVPLTKDQAKSMASYSYSDSGLRGKILNENGTVYQSSSASSGSSTDLTTAAGGTAATTGTADGSMAATDTSSTTRHDSVMNADGSLNGSEVVGLKIENGDKDNIGKIDEVLIDKSGKIGGVVVDVGGFLGVGAHTVRLDWKSLQFMQRDGTTVARVDASKDSLKAMPEYKTSSM